MHQVRRAATSIRIEIGARPGSGNVPPRRGGVSPSYLNVFARNAPTTNPDRRRLGLDLLAVRAHPFERRDRRDGQLRCWLQIDGSDDGLLGRDPMDDHVVPLRVTTRRQMPIYANALPDISFQVFARARRQAVPRSFRVRSRGRRLMVGPWCVGAGGCWVRLRATRRSRRAAGGVPGAGRFFRMVALLHPADREDRWLIRRLVHTSRDRDDVLQLTRRVGRKKLPTGRS